MEIYTILEKIIEWIKKNEEGFFVYFIKYLLKCLKNEFTSKT